MSLDRGPGVMPGRLNRQDEVRNTSLGSSAEVEQSTRRGSVNFSRPMSPSASPTSPSLEAQRFATLGEKRSNAEDNYQRPMSPATGPTKGPLPPPIEVSSPSKKKKKKLTQNLSEAGYSGSGTPQSEDPVSGNKVSPEQPTASQSTNLPYLSPTSQEPSQDAQNIVKPKKKKKRPMAATGPDGGQQIRHVSQPSYGSDSDTSERSYSFDRPRMYNTRAAGLLAKQPSIVREDREAEEAGERALSPGRLGSDKVQNGKIHVIVPTHSASTPVSHNANGHAKDTRANMAFTKASEPEAGQQLIRQAASEQLSLSPSRTAHFSAQPTFQTPDGIKHQPPARAVSPAKSALKHSPSRGSSPAGVVPGSWSRAGNAPSEASDTTSIVSDEGYRSLSKKKKNVRVSFDDDPTVVGRAATPPTSVDSPVLFSPQSKDNTKKGWFGLGREKKKSPLNSDNEDDGAIKPMPVLPSFGSVRSRKESEQSLVSSSHLASTRGQSAVEDVKSTSASSDRAIGNIIAQQASHQHQISPTQLADNLPLPPVVTSVEGSGYHSDTESSLHSEDEHEEKTMPQPKNSGPGIGHKGGIELESEPRLVPTIAVLPATPRIDDSSLETQEWLEMPGGFPSAELPPLATGLGIEHEVTDLTPSTIGIAEPQPEAAAAYHESTSPVMGEVSQALRQQTASHDDNESEDTGDSIYSDAAEDMSDLEGDGYGSINAIVESPTVPMTNVASPLSRSAQIEENPISRGESWRSEPAPDEGWDKAQAYWSGLSQDRRAQLEEAASPRLTEPITNKPTTRPKKKKTKARTAIENPISAPPASALPVKDFSTRTLAATPPQPQTKKSLRDAQANDKTIGTQSVQMRKSMRQASSESPEPVHMRSSMRDTTDSRIPSAKQGPGSITVSGTGSPEPRGTLQKKLRPVSAVAMVDYNNPTHGTNHNRSASDGAAMKSLTPVSSKPLKKSSSTFAKPQRKLSNGSDSSSSFKRTRSVNADTGRYTMKRSMRHSSVDERPRSAQVSQSMGSGLRPSSPSALTGRRPFSSGGPGMRSSMREPLESKNVRTSKSPSRSFGFGMGAKAKATTEKTSKPRFSSRFGDSSDDEDMPKVFSSRFADSSDDEESRVPTKAFTPVRGIPKRTNEGDSTDLEDSSQEALPHVVQQPSLLQPKKIEGAALASGSLQVAAGSGGVPSTSMATGAGLPATRAAESEKKKRSFFGSLGKKKDASKVVKPDVESAARRDTALERSRTARAATNELQPQSPKSPKLQRRNTPKNLPSPSWPLPDSPVPIVGNNRPNTSDGVALASRPDMGARRLTGQPDVSNGVVIGRSGKKKRFPMLRKAFGLHD